MLSDFLNQLFDSFNFEGIEFLILRNYNSLPQKVAGSDIDICIHHSQLLKIESLIKTIGNTHDFSLVSKYRKSYKIFHYKMFNFITNEFVRFDFIYAIGGGIIENNSVVSLFRHKIKYKNFWILSKRLELEVVVLQNLFSSRGKLKEKYVREIMGLSKKEFNIFCSNLIKNVPIQVGKKICDVFRLQKGLEIINNILIANRRRIVLSFILKHPIKTVKGLQDFLIVLWSRIARLPGVFVVLIGPDGSGKSTIALELKKRVSLFYPNIFYEHLYPKLLLRLQDIKNNFGSRNNEKNRGIISEWDLRKRKNGFVKSLFSMLYYSLNYTLGYWLIVFPHLLKGNLVIFDRYFYDYLYDQKSKGVSLPYWIRKTFTFFYPKPNKVIIISVQPETLLKRKNEIPYEEVVLQQNNISYLMKKSKNFVIIDNSDSLDNAVKKSIKEIIS